ncbi:CGLD2 [Auxenochlorella protothecoides x Auxenochlorella symbiontica]
MALCQAVRRRAVQLTLQLRGASSLPKYLGPEGVVGSHTPVTKELWSGQHRSWSREELEAAYPPTNPQPKPSIVTTINYPFSGNLFLREQYRNPWDEVRLGRLLEDLDSLAGFIAFNHCKVDDPAARPPLCVTAAVEAIELRTKRIDLTEDMQMSGRVAWTGSSSMDVCMELLQSGTKQLVALFTFVARDALTNAAQRISPVVPETAQDRALFARRQQISDARRTARARSSAAATGLHSQGLTPEAQRWAAALLADAKLLATAPALADPQALLASATRLDSSFICMPQQRNTYGRVFGGFLMRRAFELATCSAYMLSGTRPKLVEVDEILFRKPVDVGDLIQFSACVLHTWTSGRDPTKGMAHVQVEASVTRPEHALTTITNTFNFQFTFDLRKGPGGACLPPRIILPTTEEQALEVARFFGPGASPERFYKML